MTRYFTRPRSFHCEDEWHTDPVLPALHVPETVAICTGLLDKDGEPIWRAPGPMGFHKPGERG